MDINCLIGFRLEACRFSKSSYSFELRGMLNGVPKYFILSTPYNFTTSETANTDSCMNFSQEIWEMLEKKIISIEVVDNKTKLIISFYFENNLSFVIWADIPLEDNMFIMKDFDSEEWFHFF